ncbi:MAG TPA: type II CAAX endopeptidase family protein [Nitrospirota bacterium]|nr:type II CAAX endopeptidase family protein [Nitrospirota bacterium]
MTTVSRAIQSPPRSSIPGTIVIIATVILLSIIPFSHRVTPPAVAFATLLVLAAALVKENQAFHLSLFTAALAIMPLLHSSLREWPFNLVVPLLIYVVVVLAVPRYRRSILWLRFGRFGKDIRLLVIATAAASGIALYSWSRVLNPDLSIHLKYIQNMPIWLFPLAGLGFPAVNAAMEEFVFRGVTMQALDSAFGPGILSIVLQAWPFGAMHYREGFPNGAWGLAMTFVYGILLGALRRRAQGMFAPWIAHVCADMTIFAILAGLVLVQ